MTAPLRHCRWWSHSRRSAGVRTQPATLLPPSPASWEAVADEWCRLGRWFTLVVIDVPAPEAVVGAVQGFVNAGDLLGQLPDGKLVLVLDECTANSALPLRRHIVDAIEVVGMTAAIGVADSKQAGTVDQMLVLAVADAVLQAVIR